MERLSLAFLIGLTCLALVRPALAEEAATSDRAPNDPEPSNAEPSSSVRRFTILASAGYGESTASVRDLDMKPYAESFGLDVGYTFPMGLRLGAYGTYALGKQVDEHIEHTVTADRDVTIDSSSGHTGASFGYDVPLHVFVLRYTLNAGVTFMRFHFDGASATASGFEETNSPATGFHLAPGATLLLRQGRLECGVGFDYFVQTNAVIPNGFVGKLQLGVAL